MENASTEVLGETGMSKRGDHYMLTKRAALTLLRKKFQRQTIQAREQPDAPDSAERKLLQERRESLRQERNQFRKENSKYWKDLLEAAQFVCDVNGDPPSITNLQRTIDLVNRAISLDEEIAYIEQRLYQYRCVAYIGGTEYPADTWGEVVKRASSRTDEDIIRDQQLMKDLHSILRTD